MEYRNLSERRLKNTSNPFELCHAWKCDQCTKLWRRATRRFCKTSISAREVDNFTSSKESHCYGQLLEPAKLLFQFGEWVVEDFCFCSLDHIFALYHFLKWWIMLLKRIIRILTGHLSCQHVIIFRILL